LYCLRPKFHDECERGCDICHPKPEPIVTIITGNGGGMGRGSGKGAPTKEPENVTDRLSTGRKRAAKMWPLFKTNPCEWRGKKNCGGGKYPIIGCIDGLQKARHHGPVKEVLRNEPGNVHRICPACHNRWHSLNNPVYDEELYNTLPHKPEPATEMDLLANQAYWDLKIKEGFKYDSHGDDVE
jgi:hypothetical protein